MVCGHRFQLTRCVLRILLEVHRINPWPAAWCSSFVSVLTAMWGADSNLLLDSFLPLPYFSCSSPSCVIFFFVFYYICSFVCLHLRLLAPCIFANVRTQYRQRWKMFVSRNGFMVVTKRTNTARSPESSRLFVLRSSSSSSLLLLLLSVITLMQAKRWVKQSLYRPGHARRAPAGWGVQNL